MRALTSYHACCVVLMSPAGIGSGYGESAVIGDFLEHDARAFIEQELGTSIADHDWSSVYEVRVHLSSVYKARVHVTSLVS